MTAGLKEGASKFAIAVTLMVVGGAAGAFWRHEDKIADLTTQVAVHSQQIREVTGLISAVAKSVDKLDGSIEKLVNKLNERHK